MRVDVTMPQMGESIAEGTITRWIKQVGDSVERDEPIFEISTDKVDAEIPSPAAGTLVEIKSDEGDTVPVNEVVAIIETDADAAGDTGDTGSGDDETPADDDGPADGDDDASQPATDAKTDASKSGESTKKEKEKKEKEKKEKKKARSESKAEPAAAADDESTSRFVSPVVRRIAAEHDIDPGRIEGSGAGGRVTKRDILAAIERGDAQPRAEAAPARPATRPSAAGAPRIGPAAPSFGAGERTARERMSVMRKKIAEHMIESRRTSAHVHSVFEVDVSRLVSLRARFKDVYRERHGAKLTFMAFWIKAICDGLRDWPVINASVDGDEVVYKKDLNVGIAVALDWGLIVPVVRNADELSLAGLSKRVQDLAERARSKQLNPDEVQGGTFTITNPGQFGGLFGLPIINQPQVAILGLGGIQKRPVVIDDAIAIRSMQYMALSYDHRIVDGAVADQFLAGVKRDLEGFDESLL